MTDEATATIPAPGEVIAGKYQVEQTLGDGGMGVVLAARHLQLGRRVALKFLKAEATTQPFARQRFLREAQAASSIHSEHVARVIDVGTLDDERPYMVMEHLVGTDLARLLPQTRLSIEDAVGYLIQACEAIASAHAVGVVHRDLKPSNLFLARCADGSPLIKVLDFGIAKAIDTDRLVDGSLTTTGTALGSPMYMSPEQVRDAKVVDRRTDIWGLGATLFELLAGRPPFDADTIPALCAKIVADAPEPLCALRTDVPQSLEDVVLVCLRKDPTKRYANVGELAEALEPFAPPEAATLVERVLRIASGRASIPDGIPSWSQPDSFAETLANPSDKGGDGASDRAQVVTSAGSVDTGLARTQQPALSDAPGSRRKVTLVAAGALAALGLGWYVMPRSAVAVDDAAGASSKAEPSPATSSAPTKPDNNGDVDALMRATATPTVPSAHASAGPALSNASATAAAAVSTKQFTPRPQPRSKALPSQGSPTNAPIDPLLDRK